MFGLQRKSDNRQWRVKKALRSFVQSVFFNYSSPAVQIPTNEETTTCITGKFYKNTVENK